MNIPKQRVIFHIDVNSAFLSWESVYRLEKNPQDTDLRTIACAVGGDSSTRHGIILAKSTLAKKQGVHLDKDTTPNITNSRLNNIP